MNDLIRQAIAAEADERVDPRTVMADLHKARKRKPLGMIIGVAALTVAAAAAAVIVPTTIKKTETAPVGASLGQEAQNVLLVGLDDVNLGDALVLARFQADGTAALVSLPRDVLVDGVKINMLFAQDPKKLTAAVEKLTGTKVDHYAAIQMRDVGRIAYLLNVEVCLRAAITDPVSGVPFRAGKTTISGDYAVAFLRQRQGLPNGDLDRIKRHQVFLAGVASQLTKERAVALAHGAAGMIKIDQGWDVLAFAQRFTGPVKISMSTLPVGTPVQNQNGFAYEADPAKSKEFTDKALAGKAADPGDLCVN